MNFAITEKLFFERKFILLEGFNDPPPIDSTLSICLAIARSVLYAALPPKVLTAGICADDPYAEGPKSCLHSKQTRVAVTSTPEGVSS